MNGEDLIYKMSLCGPIVTKKGNSLLLHYVVKMRFIKILEIPTFQCYFQTKYTRNVSDKINGASMQFLTSQVLPYLSMQAFEKIGLQTLKMVGLSVLILRSPHCRVISTSIGHCGTEEIAL